MPWNISDSSVMKNTMLNICSEPGIPSTIGYVAKIIGTAPFRPTQDVKILALNEIFLNGSRHSSTVSGLPTNIRNRPISSAIGATVIISLGFTSRPSVRNIPICMIQVIPSMKERISFLWFIGLFPMMKPAM